MTAELAARHHVGAPRPGAAARL